MILHVVTRLNIGGPALQCVLLTREMPARGCRTALATGRCEPDEGDMSFLLRAGDAVHWVPEMSRSVRPWNDARAMWRLYRLMRAERPLVVHTHTAKAGTLGRIAARLAGVPVVIHTFHGNSLRGYFSPWANCVARGIERMLARVTDCICVIAEQQADEVSGELRIAPRDKFRIVPLGLDLSPFLELPEPRFDSAPFTVAWLGRFVPVKGVPLLAAVIDETLRRTDRIRFLIAGDGEQREVVRDIASRYGAGRVEWLGWQRDVAPVIARAHLLLQTSHNEGTPVALIQGMAAARSFVATPVGGVPEMCGDHALTCPPDAATFADKLMELSGQPARLLAMGRNARAFASSRYSKQRLVDDLDALYRELLRKKGRQLSAYAACASEST